MPSTPSEILQNQEYISLTTFRKNGQPVPTPVWFVEIGGRYYFRTMGQSGKIKRIRTNPEVIVAPCDRVGTVIGDSFTANAKILPPEMEMPIYQAILQKYGEALRMMQAQNASSGQVLSERIYIEIIPSV